MDHDVFDVLFYFITLLVLPIVICFFIVLFVYF